MSYPMDLDEYDDARILQEAARRRSAKAAHLCFYCEKRLDSGKACKLNAHTTPLPDVIDQEFGMQALAEMTSAMIPSGRGFVTLVMPITEDRGENVCTYVASLQPAEVPAMLREMADCIEQREAAKGG